MRRKNNSRRGTFDPQLLDHQRVADVVQACAAILLGDEDAHHAEPSQFGDGLGGKAMVAVDFDADRAQTLAREAARRVTRRALGFVKFQIHHYPRPSLTVRGRAGPGRAPSRYLSRPRASIETRQAGRDRTVWVLVSFIHSYLCGPLRPTCAATWGRVSARTRVCPRP